MREKAKALCALWAIYASSVDAGAQSWDGAVTGKVTRVEVVADAMNYGVRITLDSGTPICGAGTPDWAYMNKDFSNYDAMLSFFLTAWTTGRPINILMRKDANGYCAIGYTSSN